MKETFKEYIIKYDKDSAGVSFKAYEIVGHVQSLLGLFDVPIYGRKGGTTSSDTVRDIKEAQTCLEGMVKWDGCSHYNFGEDGYMHLCGWNNVESFAELCKHIHTKCGEMMKGDYILDGSFSFNQESSNEQA